MANGKIWSEEEVLYVIEGVHDFPNAMLALQEEFRKLGVPEEEWMWTD